MRNPDESPTKDAIGAEHTTTSAQEKRPARRGPLATSIARSIRRKRLRSDDESAQRTPRPADFPARIAKLGAAIQSTWLSRGYSPEEKLALHDLLVMLAELLDEDIPT